MPRSTAFLAAALLLGLAVTGCGGDDATTAPATTGTIAGRIINAFDQSVVPGAEVKIVETSATTTSDAQGRYSFADLQPGTYSITVTKTGFTMLLTAAEVEAGKTTDFDIQISPPLDNDEGRIAGYIYDEDGKPLSGVTVSTRPASKQVTTDARGRYALSPIARTAYTVIAVKPGKLRDSAFVSVEFSQIIDSLNFTLVDTIPMKGLAAHFKLNGNAVDAVGGAAGTVNGAVPTIDRFENATGAMGFNGTTSYISVPSSPALNLGGASSSFTISMWVRCDSLQAKYAGLLWKGKEDNFYGLDEGWRVYASEDLFNNLRLLILMGFNQAGNTYEYLVVSENSQYWYSDSWRHVAVVYDRVNKTVTRYSNGAPIQEEDLSGAYLTMDFSTTEPLLMGKTPMTGRHFYGGLDDVRIYHRALIPEQINALYHEGGYR